MKTNEENRIRSDRRIPLNCTDKIYELLGNFNGTIQAVFFDENNLIVYNNDDGFSKQDREAYKVKNQSGDNKNTAGINGLGEALVIDRLLPVDKFAKIFSISKNIREDYKFELGHFEYIDWREMNESDFSLFDKYLYKCLGKIIKPYGTLKIIPIDYENSENNDFQNSKEKRDFLKNACLKFLQNKINYDDNFEFYWQGEKQNKFDDITPCNENKIEIKYELGYDTINENLHKGHKLPLILKILNIDEIKSNIESSYNIKMFEYFALKSDVDKNEYKHKNFLKVEDGSFIIGYFSEDDKNKKKFSENKIDLKENKLDGLHIFVERLNINFKPLTKNLGSRTQEGGVFGFTGQYKYGKPRFQHHIEKNTILYNLPADKSNIRPTSKGESFIKFISSICRNNNNKSDKIKNNDLLEQNTSNKYEENKSNLQSYNQTKDLDIQKAYLNELEQEYGDDDNYYENKLNESDSETDTESKIFNEPYSNKTNRCSNDNFTPKQRSDLYEEIIDWYRENENDKPRCPCCQRYLKISNLHAGHIKSVKEGGNNNIKNGLAICNHCNNNDTRNMETMMYEEWGENHPNTHKFIQICEDLDKSL
tara:strand:+ start:278 stop:2056 length:1779 start_codon:yes stop_codon:yes gene_type:complete